MIYATVDDVVQLSGNDADTPTATQSARIFRVLNVVSRRVDREFGSTRPLFTPYLEQRIFPIDSAAIDSRYAVFRFPGSLLESPTAVSAGGTALTVGTSVVLYPDANRPPFRALRLDNDLSWYYYAECIDDPPTVDITGVWGVHRDYASAWQSVDTLAVAINASVTTLTVADVDGADLYGLTPRISPGNLLRIDSEYLLVTATNTTTNVVTVRRAVNGSTAAAHLIAAPVAVYSVEEIVRYEVARQANLMIARQGAYTTVEITGAGSEVRYPSDLLQSLRAVLNEFVYEA